MDMYQELHMWDECIMVAEAKVWNIAELKSSGWQSIQDLSSLHLPYQGLTSAWRGSKQKGRLH